jgi:arabinose-5-phosphate isomerase
LNIQDNMSSIIKMESDAIANVKVNDEFEKAVLFIQNRTGKVITTGIGKAGFVANRFAATLSSTGTPAFYIHPAEAGHGDLGMLGEGDVIVAFSTSGKSIEVVEMLQMAAEFGVNHVIGVTSHTDSPLRDLSTFTLDMGPDIEEACPLNLTPSTSIAVMSAICDAISLTLLDLNEFTKEEYGRRHHKGYLGSVARTAHKYDSEADN